MFISHMGKNSLFLSFKKHFIALIDTLDIRNNSVGLLIIVRRMIPPTSRPLPGLHTSIIKGKKICAFFASKYHLSHFFLPVQGVLSLPHHGIPSSYVDCTSYVTCSCKFSFLFFSMAVFIFRSGSSAHPLCAEMMNIQSLLPFT